MCSVCVCVCVCLVDLTLITFHSQRSNLLNQARIATLKAQDDHIQVCNNKLVCIENSCKGHCVCVVLVVLCCVVAYYGGD